MLTYVRRGGSRGGGCSHPLRISNENNLLQLINYTRSIISICARVMEVPKKKFKRSILDFFSKDVPCIDEAPTRNESSRSLDSENPSSCSLAIVPPVPPESNTSLPSDDDENSDCEPTVMGLPSSSAESIFDDHGTLSESSCAQQSIPLPVLGPCDVGSLKVSLNLCGLSDDDKYNILTAQRILTFQQSEKANN